MQKLPREPTMSTTAFAIEAGGAAAPPTIAAAGRDEIRKQKAMRAPHRAHQPGACAIVNGNNIMSSILLSGPAVEPVTLAEAKPSARRA